MSPRGSGLRAPRTRWPIERLVRERNTAIGSALALSSNKTYDSALKSWLNFAKLHDFSIEPTPDTLSYYITYESMHIEPRSVNSYLSGIISKLEPYFPDIRKMARGNMLIYRTLRGRERLYSNPVERKRPLMLADIRMLWNMLHSFNSFDDKLFLCVIETGFFTLQRLGEIARPDDCATRDYRRYPTRHSVKLFSDRVEYMLPVHKSDLLFEGNKIVLQHVDDFWNPATVFRTYLTARDSKFPLNPYLWLTPRGEPPTKSWVVSRMQSIFGSNVAGHSLRSGGATFLALRGVPDERIQAIGRWSSEAWKSYIRTHPVTQQAVIWGRPTFQVEA